MDDIVVDYTSQGLQARNKCASFPTQVSSVRNPVPGEFMTCEGIQPFVAEGDAYLRGGAFSHDALLAAAKAVVTGALGDSYQRIWTLGNVSFAVRELNLRTWLVADFGLTEFAPRYPQFLTRMCNLDLFDSEATMHALRTRPPIHLNRIIIPDSDYIPAKQFLDTS